jgi:hypothetical protein
LEIAVATGGGLIGALRATLGLDTANFEAGSKRARSIAKRDATAIQKSLDDVRKSFKNMIAAASVGALTVVTKRALEYASSLGEVAQQLGVTTKELQEYRYAASQVGISNEEMDKSLAKLTRNIGEAKAGSKAQATTFRELGVAIQDANGKVYTAGEVIPKLADALAKIKDPATRARLEIELFGKTGQKLDTLLAGGSAAVNGLRDAAQKLGVVLSDEQIQNADETADKLAAMKQVLEARIAGVVSDNADAILSLANAFAQLANMAGAANRAVPGLLAVLAGATIGGRLGGLPGAGIGGLLGGAGALLDRAINDPHGLRNETPKNLVARQRKLTAQIKTSSRSGNADTADFKELAEISNAIDAEINRRLAVMRAGQASRAVTPVVGDGALPTVAPSGGGKPKKPPKDKTQDYLERYERELAGLADDQLQLQQEITTDAHEKARLEHLRLETSKAAYDHDVENRQTAGELTKEQAEQLRLAKDANTTREHTLVNWKLDDELTSQELAITRARLDNEQELLRGDLAAARTQAARRRIQLAILAREEELERASLEALIARHDTTEVEKAIAQAKLDQLARESGQRADAIRRDTMGPLESYLDGIPDSIDRIDEAFQSAAVNGLGQFKQGIADAIVSGGNLFDVLMSGLRQFTSQLLQMQIDQGLKALLGGVGGGGGGSGIAKAAGGLLGALGGSLGRASSSVTPAASSWLSGVGGTTAYLPGFAEGGSLRIGGAPGRDRNILSINGKPRARVSANENLRIEPANDRSASGDTYNLSVTVPGAMSDRDARRTGAQIAAGFQRRQSQTTKQGIS